MAHDDDRYWQAGATLMEQDGVTRSTMMGLPCLRIWTKFFAAYDRASGDLLVKLPAARVDQLIADGSGGAVAPSGRRFREWVAIAADDFQQWPDFLAEACAFVTGISPHPGPLQPRERVC
jgi:hypothetical protein